MEGGFRVKIEEVEEEIKQRRRKMEVAGSKKNTREVDEH
jgi:hypothetical protein